MLRYPDRLNQFGESAGNLELRQLICDQILPSGHLSHPGSADCPRFTVWKSASGHDGTPREHVFILASRATEFARNFSRFGYNLQSHRMDPEGIDLSDFRPTAKDILYLMPEHHFPQCITLSDSRRSEIIHLASQKRCFCWKTITTVNFTSTKFPALPSVQPQPQNRSYIWVPFPKYFSITFGSDIWLQTAI